MTTGLQIRDVTRTFASGSASLLHSRPGVEVLKGVSLELKRGEVLGLVGESGSGKSTLARIVVGLDHASSGEIILDGEPLFSSNLTLRRGQKRALQMVFQDPKESLNPRMRIGDTIAEGIRIHGLARGAELDLEVARLLAIVGLPEDAAKRYPGAFSGGQRQRIGIARALAVKPGFIIADEPVSALDLSIQAQIINLFSDLRTDLGLGMIFISHDLAVVQHISDRIAVMFRGRIVELAPNTEFKTAARHPYTKALKAASADVGESSQSVKEVDHDVLAAAAPEPGCAYRSRCPIASPICASETPLLRSLATGHIVACHHVTNPQ